MEGEEKKMGEDGGEDLEEDEEKLYNPNDMPRALDKALYACILA